MRPQRRETPLRPGPGTVPALERQPRRPPVLGTATTAARLNRTTTPLNGADLAEVHAGYSRARSQDFRILTQRVPRSYLALLVGRLPSGKYDARPRSDLAAMSPPAKRLRPQEPLRRIPAC